MAREELLHTLDFILNRCSEQDIEAVAAAVVRRRKDIALSGGVSIPSPHNFAKELSAQLNIEGSIETLKNSVREYAIRIIKQQAPELTERQIEELTKSWVPDVKGSPVDSKADSRTIPHEVLSGMIDQFVAFSLGRMEEEEDHALRKEMGPWTDKYWKAFPEVVRLLLKDFIKGEITEKDFYTRLGLALQMR